MTGSWERQSEVIVNAVFYGVPSHFLDRFMTAMIPFLSESDQILEVNPSMTSYSMEGDFSFIEQPNQKLSREPQEVRGFLRGHLLRCGCQRDRTAVRQVLDDLQEDLVGLIGQSNLVHSGYIAERSPAFREQVSQFRDSCLIEVGNHGWFQNR